jgi:hypothetical protein
MIHSNNLLVGVGIAEAYADKGLVISALPGTVISELDRLAYGSLQANALDYTQLLDLKGEDQEYVRFANDIEVMSGGSLDNATLHDQFQDSVLDTIIKAVQKHIGFAKNVVKPIVVEYAQGVRERLQAAVPPSAASQFTVEVVDIPEILQELSFLEALKPYKGKAAIKPNDNLPLGEKTDDELLALLQLGEAGLDGFITAWYSRKGSAWFQKVWLSFFRPKDVIVANAGYYTTDEVLGMNPFDRADMGLAIYLWSRRLYDEIDASSQGLNLAAYQARCAEWRDFGGGLLDESIRRIGLYDQNQTMVIDTLPTRKLIRVYGTPYRLWLEGGGSPEILFGLLLSGKRLFNKAAIDQDVNELKQRWHTYVLFHNAAENNRSFDMFKDILRVQFETSIGGIMEGEKSFIDKTPHYYDIVRSKFEAELKGLKADSMQCLDTTAMVLMCRSRFYYTQAESILKDIQQAAALNQDIDVREAALLATINYVTDYVADQLTLTKE